MHVHYRRSVRLPRLAWCADVDQRSERVVVSHGRSIEIGDGFFIEGAWNGDFAAGEFASTECVFGSGAVSSARGITFVPSCSTTDPLFYATGHGHVLVSNSLAFLLAATDDELDFSYTRYFEDCESIIRGINDYQKVVPTQHGSVRRLLFRNLLVTTESVQEIDKPLAPPLATYADYYAYLTPTTAASPPTFAACGGLSRSISCQRSPAATTRRLSTRSPRSTGLTVCSRRRIPRAVIRSAKNARRASRTTTGRTSAGRSAWTAFRLTGGTLEKSGFPDEHLYYASQAGNQDANLLEINSHVSRVSVLLTGVLGESRYDQLVYAQRPGYITPELRRFDVSGHGMTEVRLRAGFVQLALPYLGAQRREDIYLITNSSAMDRWRVNPAYDRPIPRRIAEERGVPRQFFGQVKMGSVLVFPSPCLPHNPQLRQEFLDALIDRGGSSAGRPRRGQPFTTSTRFSIADRQSVFARVLPRTCYFAIDGPDRSSSDAWWSYLNGSLDR